jgi:hypothetical protein
MESINGLGVNSSTAQTGSIVIKKRKISKLGKKKDAPEVPTFMKSLMDHCFGFKNLKFF